MSDYVLDPTDRTGAIVSEKRERWTDIPGLVALVVVVPGMGVFLGLFAVLSFLIHGEWPSW